MIWQVAELKYYDEMKWKNKDRIIAFVSSYESPYAN